MVPNYDVLVIDLDGTLLAPDGTVSQANTRAIDRAREAGIEIIVATGRALAESLDFLEAIEHQGMVVAAGGAILSDAATGRTIDYCPMPYELVADVTNELLLHDHRVLLLKNPDAAGYDYLLVGEAELDSASRWWFRNLPVRVQQVDSIDQDPHPGLTVRAGIVACGSVLAPIAERLSGEIGDRCFLQHWAAVTETEQTGAETHILEVFSPNVSKWSMVQDQCRIRGVDRSRIAAIGDGLNDVQIVREVGLGIAMGNSDHRVAAVADRVTRDNLTDGVAAAIDNILGGLW